MIAIVLILGMSQWLYVNYLNTESTLFMMNNHKVYFSYQFYKTNGKRSDRFFLRSNYL
jgi:hypothetical protein